MCCCAIGCQHSTLNRLFGSWFGCVFLVWRHHSRIIGAHFQMFFSTIFLFLTFLNIHIYFIILKTYDQQFTLTTKKSLHIIFKILCRFVKRQCRENDTDVPRITGKKPHRLVLNDRHRGIRLVNQNWLLLFFKFYV